METILLVTVLAGTLVLLGFSAVLLRRVSAAAQVDVNAQVANQIERLDANLGQKISISTADMASRLEQTKGDLRQQVTDRIQQGFSEIRTSVEQQLAAGREEQTRRLLEARGELSGSLIQTTQQLKAEFQTLNQQTAQSLDSIRDRVDAMMAAASPAAAAAALRGRAERPDYRPVLARLEVPALVCAGSADPWSNREVTAEMIACLKHPEVLMIDGAGHLPNLEAEREFNDALRAFLRTHAPS